MWRRRKWAEGRSALRRWRADSRAGCREREDIWCEGMCGGVGEVGREEKVCVVEGGRREVRTDW